MVAKESDPGFVGPRRPKFAKESDPGFVGPRRPKFAKESDPGFVGPRRPSGGGSGGFVGPIIPESIIRQRAEATRQAQQKLAIEKARLENLRKQQQATALRNKNLATEQNRIKQLEQRLLREGASRNIRNLTNEAGDKIQHETLIKRNNERIFIVKNLTTGNVSTRTFERAGGSGRTFETGGLVTGGVSQGSRIDYNKQLNNLIKLEQAKIIRTNRQLTRIERINLFGAKLSGREQQYLDSLTLRDLNKERDDIYARIGRVNSHYERYPPKTEAEYTQYQKNLAPLLAKYNTYANAKKIVLKNQPDKSTKAVLQFDPVLNRNVLVLGGKDKSLTNRINQAVNKSTIAIQRKAGVGSNTLKLSALIVGQTIVGTATGIIGLPSFANAVRKNPAILKQLPSAIAKAGADFGTLLRVSPTAALVKIGANVYMIRVTDAGFRQLGRLSSAAFVRLNPKFVGVLKAGQKIAVKTGRGKRVNLQVVNKIPTQSISKQIGLAGKKVNAISTQADNLIGLFKRSKVLRKPLGVTKSGTKIEKLLSKQAKIILKKFDSGKQLTIREIKILSKDIETLGSKGLLERSFFADPTGTIRPSRTGIIKESKLKLMNYLTGDITFKKARPQILLFENAQIQKFPKTVQSLIKKMEKGIKLTPNEYSRYIQFQLKLTGKFKTLGFPTRESEILLAAGEVIKRVKKVGVTRLHGVNIPIIKVKIVKLSKALKNSMNKFQAGKLTASEINKLDRALTKATGFKYGLSSSGRAGIRYINLKRLGLSVGSRTLRRKRTSRKSPASRRSKVSKPSRKSKSIKSRTSKSPRSSKSPKRSKSPRSSKVSRSPRVSRSPKSPKSPRSPKSPTSRKPIPKKPPVRIPLPKEKFKKRTIAKKVPVYYVKEKVRGKLINLTPRPLKLREAKDFLAYRLDNRLSRTGYFEPLGKSKIVVGLPSKMKGYFGRNSRKYRKYRVKVGVKKALRNGLIERTKYIQDTVSEKRQIKRARQKAKRKKTPLQRKAMLRNLKKSRKIKRKVVKRKTTKKRKRSKNRKWKLKI